MPRIAHGEAATPTLRPPVRWYGGKRYLAKWIIAHFPPHETYLEAFGGGASVLLNKEPAAVETYNDLDRRVSRFFRVLRNQGDAFVRRIRQVPYSQVEFSEAPRYPKHATELDKAVCDFTAGGSRSPGRAAPGATASSARVAAWLATSTAGGAPSNCSPR